MHSGDYQNVFKYDSPPFNPGVRRWYGVKPEYSIVDFPDASTLNFQTQCEFPDREHMDMRLAPPPFGCGYPTPFSPPVGGERVEAFGLAGGNLILNIIIIALVIYLIYYLMSKKKSQ